VAVTNGLFAVTLDFGNQFPGADRWLEIAVRTNGVGNFATLTPRQPLTPTPYAIRAASAGTATTATTATIANSVAAGAVNGTALAGSAVDSSKIADGSIAAGDLSPTVLSNTFWRLMGNAGTTPGVNFIGTTDGQALRIQAPQVGINTATPRGPLEVNTGAGSIIFRNEGNVSPGITVSNSPNEGVLRFRHRLEVWPNPSATEFGTLDVRGTNGAVTVRLPGSGAGYFTAGNFGIGTNNPQDALHVGGPFLRVTGAGGEGAYLGGNGFANDVQLGSVNPAVSEVALFNRATSTYMDLIARNLHATSPGQFLGIFDGSNTGGTWLNLRNTSSGGREWNFISTGSGNSEGPGKLLLRDAVAGVVMTLSTDGNVGLGTAMPQEKLHVAGKFVRVDGIGNEQAYLGGDGIGGEVQVGSLNPAINNVLLWNAGNNTTMDLIADQITANQFNGPLNGSLSGTFSGGVSASSFKLGNSSTAGSVLIASDGIGSVGFQSNLRVFDAGFSTDNGNIAGGRHNTLGAGIVGAVIAGGGNFLNPNQVTGNLGTVSGGSANSAGNLGTVPGGSANSATGQYSFAAGRRAKANHQGTFVWADSQNSDFASTANNQFLIRAGLGVGINTPSPQADLDVNGYAQIRGSLIVDGNNGNNGFLNPGLVFAPGSGEGIGSRRTSGDNQNGLDFYTGFSRRLSITNDGSLYIHNNPLYLRTPGDRNHGLTFRSSFAGQSMDGPALFGYANGVLGTMDGGENWSLRWDKNEVKVKVLTITGGMDLAEPFTMKEEAIEPGSVVVIDNEHPGRLKLSGQAYDTRVAGIVSGAGGVKPGIALYQEGIQEGGQNVALSGRVYVKADASHGAIRPGDLLTTSERPGHAMKVGEHGRSQGAILGKAMSALNEGTGLVLVLVTLQ
jgi:hypothetical protein